ncbi:ABC transporter ATP-binding protein [Mesorhizobium sp. KR1-2]|uniref:ABC transporter ATP-binding protein n=1 Tax=Mesorhizobium sp. KR1-2 TaxID=3156609 RepID=UPI0032B5D140
MVKAGQFLPQIQRDILGTVAGRRKGTIALFLAVTLLASLCAVAGPLLFAHAVKVIGAGSYTTGMLLGIFLAFALAMAGTRLLADVRMVLMNVIEQDVILETNKKSLAALLSAGGSIFVTNNAAKLTTLVRNLHMSNTIYIQMFLMVVLAGTVDLVLSFLAIGGYVSWVVAVFVVVYGVASVWLTMRASAAAKPYHKSAAEKANEGANLLGNVVANVVSIKIFRAQPWVQALYENFAKGAQMQWLAFYRVRLRFGAIQGALVFIQYASILAMLVLTLKSPDLLNQVVLVSMVLVQLNRPFEMIAAAISEFVMAKVLAGMLQSELDQHPASRVRDGGQTLPAGRPLAVELSHLSFAYAPEDRPVLSDLSARFEPGRLNFIIGPSGAGKSSLLQILLGINDAYDGTVKVAGIERGSVNIEAYLATIGYVPQEPMLMNLSIRDNVLFGRDFSDLEVREALEAVQLGGKLASLQDGLDFVIGERGQLLSGGERQRLAIARALIARPQILILDEASSALDEATERGIFANLRAIGAETTVIAVTHRLGVITSDDQVLSLSKPEALQGEPLPA